MIPTWLHDLSIGYLMFGALSATIIAIDLARHKQPMWIMNLVWPTAALFGTIGVAWQYFVFGRRASEDENHAVLQHGQGTPSHEEVPLSFAVASSALHCGAGCTLGDIVAEWLVFAVPAVTVAFGYNSVFGDRIFAVWVVDFILSYAYGIFFQYFTIAPMRGLGLGEGLMAAIKADTLSLSAWQLGMFGFMAIAHFYIFGRRLHVPLQTDTVEFWFMMQIAMICGFLTAYPVNWWLIQCGVKDKM